MGAQTLLGVQALGSLYGGYSSLQAGRANAAAAEREADTSRAIGTMEADRIRSQGRQLLAKQRVLTAGSGLDVTQGSPLLVMLDTITGTAKDASLATWKGEQRAGALEMEAAQQRKAGRRAMIAGIVGAAGAAGKSYLWNRRRMDTTPEGD